MSKNFSYLIFRYKTFKVYSSFFREGGGSNLIVVSSGSTLTEALVSSSVCRGEDGTAAPVVAASGGGFEFGIDPEDDPDLALACISHYYVYH